LIEFRTGETTANLLRVELDQKLVFKPNPKIESKLDLGLKEGNRKVIHRGDVLRKSDTKLEWLDIYLILLDNYLIMTKKRRERGVERYYVSKQVIHSIKITNLAYSRRFITIGRSHRRRCIENWKISRNNDKNGRCTFITRSKQN
jgi:hypothetical protein